MGLQGKNKLNKKSRETIKAGAGRRLAFKIIKPKSLLRHYALLSAPGSRQVLGVRFKWPK